MAAYAAARDVTDRVEAEQRMREAEARFRRAFEDSPAGMALVGARGDEADRANRWIEWSSSADTEHRLI